MRIEMSTEGGFVAAPGLAKPVVLDTATMPPDEAAACEQLVRDIVAEAAQPRPQALMRDGRSYRLRLELDGREVALKASDGAMSPAWRQLMKVVRASGSR